MGRIPSDGFEVYLALGDGRSYQAVADKFGVSKRSVTKKAGKERWQERLAAIEKTARERAEEEYTETLQAVNRRHLKMMQALQGKALEALKNYPIHNAAAAARALDIAVARERAIRGTPDTRPGKVDSEPGQTIIVVETGVPARASIDPPKALPAPPSNGHNVRRPGVN